MPSVENEPQAPENRKLNRPFAGYFLSAMGGLFVGIPISYFFQSGILRTFFPLFKYCVEVARIIPGYLFDGPAPPGNLGIRDSVATTALWTMAIGAVLGLVLYHIYHARMIRKSDAQ